MRHFWLATLAGLVVLLAAPVAGFELRPYEREELILVGDRGIWGARISYRPGGTYAHLWLLMDNERTWEDLTYRIDSAEAWLPGWEGRVANQVAGRITLDLEFVTPEPMDAETAKRLGRGLRVLLNENGRDTAVTFSVAPSDRFSRWTIPEAFQHWWIDRWLTEPKIRTVN